MATLYVGTEVISNGGINGKVGVNTATPDSKFDVVGGNSKLGGGSYSTGHLVMGNYHIWVDGNGRLRIKNGIPTSNTDGQIVGLQS